MLLWHVLLLLALLFCLLVGRRWSVVMGRLWGWLSSGKQLTPRTGVVHWGSYTGPPVPPVLGRRDGANVPLHPPVLGRRVEGNARL